MSSFTLFYTAYITTIRRTARKSIYFKRYIYTKKKKKIDFQHFRHTHTFYYTRKRNT